MSHLKPFKIVHFFVFHYLLTWIWNQRLCKHARADLFLHQAKSSRFWTFVYNWSIQGTTVEQTVNESFNHRALVQLFVFYVGKKLVCVVNYLYWKILLKILLCHIQRKILLHILITRFCRNNFLFDFVMFKDMSLNNESIQNCSLCFNRVRFI